MIGQKTIARIKRWRMSDIHMENTLYKASHINHPTNIWVRATASNYLWMYGLWESLVQSIHTDMVRFTVLGQNFTKNSKPYPKTFQTVHCKKYRRQCQMMSNVMTLLRRIKNTIANTKHTFQSGLTDPHQSLCLHDSIERRFSLQLAN